jgi:magnesium transporter
MLRMIPSSAASLAEAVWIDLLQPSDEERSQVEGVIGLRLPSQAEIEEIEWSSRVYLEKGALYLSTPVPAGVEGISDAVSTLGFVLSSAHLVTLRFAPVAVIDRLMSGEPERTSGEALLKILDAIVDHAADSFERAGAELERISGATFRSDRPHSARMADLSGALHAALRNLGRIEEGTSHIRDTLLGIERITAFLLDGDCNQRLVDSTPRLEFVRADIKSLKGYHVHLTGKVQFLLDATLGFINIQQNEIVKALTVASVVGVPPVLVAGIYGMNFKFMPELSWSFGYPLGLILIVASALFPVVVFKWRGWM